MLGFSGAAVLTLGLFLWVRPDGGGDRTLVTYNAGPGSLQVVYRQHSGGVFDEPYGTLTARFFRLRSDRRPSLDAELGEHSGAPGRVSLTADGAYRWLLSVDRASWTVRTHRRAPWMSVEPVTHVADDSR